MKAICRDGCLLLAHERRMASATVKTLPLLSFNSSCAIDCASLRSSSNERGRPLRFMRASPLTNPFPVMPPVVPRYDCGVPRSCSVSVFPACSGSAARLVRRVAKLPTLAF